MDFSNFLYLDKHTVFIYFSIFLGIILFLINFRLLYKSRVSESWSRTNGKVIKSQLDKMGSGGEDSITYKPVIEYEYEVEQKLYNSKDCILEVILVLHLRKEKVLNLFKSILPELK